MNFGVSSYCFSSLTDSGRLSLIDVIHKAKEIGFDSIEFTPFPVPAGETKQSYAAQLRKECESVGLKMCNYAVGADFLNNSEGWRAEADRLKEEIEIAQILGSPMMRHDATWGLKPGSKGKKGFDDVLPVLTAGCRAVTEYAAELGIKTTIENHGYFCQDSDRVEKLINAVDHENFGLLLDMGNFLCVDEDPAEAAGKLMPYVFHVHAKDFHVKTGMHTNPGSGWFQSRGGNYLRGAIIGHGEAPILQTLSILKKHNYEGTISVEFEGLEDPDKGVTLGLDNLRRLMGLV